MIAQPLSPVPVFTSLNFDARFAYGEVRRCAQVDLRRDGAGLHFNQMDAELPLS